MLLTSKLLSRLADLELSPLQLSGVLAILADAVSAEEERKRKDRERKPRKGDGKSGAAPGNSKDIPGNHHGNSGNPSPKENIKPPTNYTGEGAGARDLENLFAQLCEAAGGAIDDTRPRMQILSEPRAWLASGADLHADVLTTIRALSAGKAERSIRSWTFYAQAIADARERRLSGLPPANPINGSTHHAQSGKRGVSALAFDIARKARERENLGELPPAGRG